MKRIVVTGGTGFVGKRLVTALLNEGHAVDVWTRDPKSAGLPTHESLNVLRWEANGELPTLEGVDSIAHLAAYLPAEYSDSSQAAACLKVNALGTLALLEAAEAAGVESLVYTSSGNIYAPGDHHADETSSLYPSWRAPYYLTSKLAGEVYVDHCGRAGKLRTAILRPSAIYGPGMKGGVVEIFARRLAAGEPVTLNNGGTHAVDLVYVDDVVAAIKAALTRDVSGAYNVGGGRRVTVREIAETLRELLDAPRELLIIQPVHDESTAGFAGLIVERARDELDYRPRPLEEGLSAYVETLAQTVGS